LKLPVASGYLAAGAAGRPGRYGAALLFLLLLPAGNLSAGQYAVLSSGTRVEVERHESEGPRTRLYLPGGGFAEVDSSLIVRFEADEYAPPPPAAGNGAAAQNGGLDQVVRSSGQRHGLDPDLIHSVIRAESAGNPRAVSEKGASGLMQLMPATARNLNVEDVFNPTQNVEGGSRYLRQLLSLYNNDLQLALAAYNAGPDKVAAYKGIPPYAETRQYVSRVIRSFNRKKLSAAEKE